MGTTLFTELHQELVTDLPGASLAQLNHNIVRVIRDFCTKTYSWTFDLDAISVVAEVSDYELDFYPSYSEVERVLIVVLDGVTLTPGVHYTIADRCHTIHLVSEPQRDITAGLEVNVALRPKLSATKICSAFYNNWFEVWAHGVLARMMANPNKTWSNPSLFSYHNSLFWDGIRDARIEQQKGGTVKTLTARPKYKFA